MTSGPVEGDADMHSYPMAESSRSARSDTKRLNACSSLIWSMSSSLVSLVSPSLATLDLPPAPSQCLWCIKTVFASFQKHITQKEGKQKKGNTKEASPVHQSPATRADVVELLFQTIQQAAVDTRTELYKHIVLSGGSSMYPGFPSRLEKEMKQLYLTKVLGGDGSRLKVRYRSLLLHGVRATSLDRVEASLVVVLVP